MKAKQWLLDNGHIEKVGRGRISLENHARLKAAHDAGTRFSDWPKGAVTVSEVTSDEGPAKVVARVEKSNNPSEGVKVPVHGHITFPEDKWRAVATETGKRIGMREVCNNCRVSLVGHACDAPTVHGNIAVEVKPIVGRTR